MKRKFLLLAVLFVCGALSSFAQRVDLIKSDPEMIWASGKGSDPVAADGTALDALLARLSRLVEFQGLSGRESALMETYREEVRRYSHRISDGASVLRYLSVKELPLVFESRRRKVDELESAGDRTGQAVYYEWAEVELSSLPGDRKDRLRELSRKRKAAPDKAAVDVRAHRMGHLAREIERIRTALQEAPALLETPFIARSVPEKTEEPVLRRQAEPLVMSQPVPAVGVSVPVPEEHPEFRTSVFPAQEPVVSTSHRRFSILVGGGCFPEAVAGVMGAVQWRRWGCYVSAFGNAVSPAAAYSCLKDGTAGDRYIWPSGASRVSVLHCSGGVVRNLTPCLAVTAGGGWGRRLVRWEDTSGNWASVEDLSVQGPILEAGLLGWRGRLCASVGVSTVTFRTLGVKAAFGIRF